MSVVHPFAPIRQEGDRSTFEVPGLGEMEVGPQGVTLVVLQAGAPARFDLPPETSSLWRMAANRLHAVKRVGAIHG